MKIAFITYEYPPDTADGGIGTYSQQAAEMLVRRGHTLEVFAGSRKESGSVLQNGVMVHRIFEEKHWEFHRSVAGVFAERHAKVGFDVLESPEYHAPAREAIRFAPELPLVVKLHTPSYLMQWIASKSLSPLAALRARAGGARRGTGPIWHPCHPRSLEERLLTQTADEVAVPCLAIGYRVIKDWNLNSEKVSLVPSVYEPGPRLLDIPIGTQTERVTYLGRLEYRKGVLDLARAIPLVLRTCPGLCFRFIGRDQGLSHSQSLIPEMKEILGSAIAAVEFAGPRPMAEIPSLLAETDICVFPSLWENFPLACLEAMAAGRGVIASEAGGMAEQLDEGRAGRLIAPQKPDAIAREIIFLAQNPQERQRLGKAARQRVLEVYNEDRIGQMQEESYQRAIDRKRLHGDIPAEALTR